VSVQYNIVARTHYVHASFRLTSPTDVISLEHKAFTAT